MHRGFGHLVYRLLQCRERRCQIVSDLESIEADDRDILRYAYALIAERPETADCDGVRDGEDRIELRARPDQIHRPLISILIGIGFLNRNRSTDQCRIRLDAMLLERVQVALETEHTVTDIGFRIAEKRDSLPSMLEQIITYLFGFRAVIDRHIGVLGEGLPVRNGHRAEHERNRQTLQTFHGLHRIAAEEDDAVQALLTGKIDCVIIDNEPAKAFVAANEGLTILDTEYVKEEYAIAVAKGNDELLAKLNEALKALTDDGTIPAIIEKYIPTDAAAEKAE